MKTLTISKSTISKLNTTKEVNDNGRTTGWGTRMGRTTGWGTRA